MASPEVDTMSFSTACPEERVGSRRDGVSKDPVAGV